MRATNRLNFYPVVVVDGQPERDVLSGRWYRFQMHSPPTYHRVRADEVHRADLIAWRVYGDPYLWWFVLKANAIVDPFSLTAGQLLTIPAIADYWAFYHEAAV